MIREPVVSGRFYPSDPEVLRRDLAAMLDSRETGVEAKAILVPHAGYMYSGAVAGAVYGAIRIPKRIIVLGPNHTGRGASLSLFPPGEWRTPLGNVRIDPDMTAHLLQECPDLQEDRAAHMSEHSLEVQIPFLQAREPKFSIAAICVGTAQYPILESLGHALARTIQWVQEPVLLIASSDMTHYEPADVAASKDQLAIDQVIALDPKGLHRTVLEKDISMCGFAPAIAVLTACLDLKASGGRLVRYANSGEVSGDYDSVVGYAGILIC
jgi:AmmeMemoRadiSam system protein B